jgi:predicted DNA-binding protein with PD1-like motif
MKLILQDNNIFVLRFDKDEEVIAGIASFMEAQSIKACTFTAIGAVSAVELGYFNTYLKAYRKKPYMEEFEVISLNGNGSLIDGKPTIHAHGLFGRNDFTSLGGHVFTCTVAVTCEVTLVKLSGEMKREKNTDFDLNLLA